MKIFIILTLLFSSQLFGQVYEHEKLQRYVGYDSLFRHPDINRTQLDFLQFYAHMSGAWYEEVNEYLRTGQWAGFDPIELNSSVSAVDSLIEKTPKLPSDVILFRGQNMSFFGRHFGIGERFVDGAYFSTTTKQSTAMRYSGYDNDSFVMVLYFGGDVAEGLVLNNKKLEVLLGRNHVYKVMDSIKGTGRRYGLVQVCPDSGCKPTVSKEVIRSWWNHFKTEKLSNYSY